MQYKLLQFYKVLSNFSTNLISAFVPLLIYQQTHNLNLAVLCLILQTFSQVVFVALLKKFLYAKPQLCLLLRVVPIIILQIFLIFLSKSPWISVIGCSIFTGLNYTFKNVPSEIVFNYATPPKASSKALAITRFSEEMGYMLSGIIGGFFLDYVDYTIVIFISLGLYLVSCLPLVIYYFNNKKEKTFNAEHVSTAYLHYENKVQDGRGKKVSKKIWFSYFLEYCLLSGIDAIYALFGLIIYMKSGSFLLAGALGAGFDLLYGVSSLLVGKLDEKFDLTYWTAAACVVMAGMAMVMSFTAGEIISYVMYEAIAVLWPLMTIFVQQRMLMKAKILGISNDCSLGRQQGVLIGNGFSFLFGFISIPAIVIVSAVLSVTGGIILPINEEKTRDLLVNYLENNDSKTT